MHTLSPKSCHAKPIAVVLDLYAIIRYVTVVGLISEGDESGKRKDAYLQNLRT